MVHGQLGGQKGFWTEQGMTPAATKMYSLDYLKCKKKKKFKYYFFLFDGWGLVAQSYPTLRRCEL